jgi:acyl-CoA oxidase
MLNKACDIFANPGAMADEMLAICCIIKTMVGWNFERVATTGRERCGGMGYLSISRFHDYLSLAHTSLTAEGDNRVLMVKIVKDMITGIAKKTWKLPQTSLNVQKQIGTYSDVTQADTLLDLLKFREVDLFKKLAKKTKDLTSSGKSGYEALMFHTSNLVQDLAMAYGERHTFEASLDFLKTIKCDESRKVMTTVFRVFAIDAIKKNLGYYISEGAVSAAAARNLLLACNSLIKQVALNINELVAVLDVPDDLLYAPLAQNYVDYYSRPNFGEAAAARL